MLVFSTVHKKNHPIPVRLQTHVLTHIISSVNSVLHNIKRMQFKSKFTIYISPGQIVYYIGFWYWSLDRTNKKKSERCWRRRRSHPTTRQCLGVRFVWVEGGGTPREHLNISDEHRNAAHWPSHGARCNWFSGMSCLKGRTRRPRARA